MDYRFLDPADIPAMFTTFTKAFADYFVDSRMSPGEFENHLTHNAVCLSLSVGAFVDQELVGILLNAIDQWDGELTAYDAGTGIVPAYRGQGTAGAMFDFALPKLRDRGVCRCLLEVIQENEPAIRAYRKLGFATHRVLECYTAAAAAVKESGPPCAHTSIVEPRDPEWERWQTFWDWSPSWQNGIGSVIRSKQVKFRGALRGEHCVGYIVFVPSRGRIIQLAVDKNARRVGIGSSLLDAVRRRVDPQQDLSIINVDGSAISTSAFLLAHGFEKGVVQYEMVRPIPRVRRKLIIPRINSR